MAEKTIFLTWNLFWQTAFFPLCLVVLAWWLARKDKKKDKLQQEKEETQAKYDLLKEQNYEEWRNRFVDGLCDVKNTVKTLSLAMPTLVTNAQCDESHTTIWNRIDEYGNRITAVEHDVKHIQGKGKE